MLVAAATHGGVGGGTISHDLVVRVKQRVEIHNGRGNARGERRGNDTNRFMVRVFFYSTARGKIIRGVRRKEREAAR